MTAFWVSLQIFSLFFLLFALVMMVRNHYVFEERMRWTRHISDACLRDVQNGIYDTNWRRAMYDSAPSYDYMMTHFWRRPSSFAPMAAWEEKRGNGA